VQMPEMDGLAATAAIRDMEKATGKRLPIFALTAHAMKGDSEVCLQAGMDGYPTKPVRLSDVEKILSTVGTSTVSSEKQKHLPAQTDSLPHTIVDEVEVRS